MRAPTRRRLLTGSDLAAGLVALSLPVAAPASADPVVALYAEWCALEAALMTALERHSDMRNMLVSRYGECLRTNLSARDIWGHDPSYAEFSAITARSRELENAAADALDLIVDMPAVSMEGVRCKLRVLVQIWAYIERPAADPDHHETVTLAMLRDTARFMGAEGVA